MSDPAWLDALHWNSDGLVAAIVQDADDGTVLMLAWMSRESLRMTLAGGEAVYWSRSRKRLWHKGEESGHTQKVRSLRLDCDGDALLLQVEQVGGVACHTGRRDCFFRRFDNGDWHTDRPVLVDPQTVYTAR